MGRVYFKPYMVHSCFDPDLYEISLTVRSKTVRLERFKEVLGRHSKALKQECRCKYWVDGNQAKELVDLGAALPLIDDRAEPYFITRHLVARMAAKTPRAHTIEKAHMERAVTHPFSGGSSSKDSDGGAFQEMLENEEFGLIGIYHDIEVEERLRLFGKVSSRLLEYKKISDRLGTIEGIAGKYANDIVMQKVNEIKAENPPIDLSEGEPLTSYIGLDERTSVPITHRRE